MSDEENIPGASGRLLGVNNLQRALDATERIVGRLTTAVEHALPVIERGVTGASSARTGVRAGSNWTSPSASKPPNGGGSTFGGQPAGGSHRADGPAQVGGSGSWYGAGGGARSNGNGYATAGFIGGAAYSLGSKINSNVGHNWKQSADDSRLMLNFSQYYGMNTGNSGSSMFSGYSTAQNTSDLVGAATQIALRGGAVAGSSKFRGLMAQASQSAISNPFMSMTQAAQYQTSLMTPTGYNSLRLVGIQTVNKGQTKSPIQIAQEVLSAVGLSTTKLTAEQIAYVLDDPMSKTNQTLSNWVAHGIITADQMSVTKENMRAILLARQKGMDANTLGKVMSASQGKGKNATSAKEVLKGIGIERTQVQNDKNLEESKRDASIQRLEGFGKGLEQSTRDLTAFHHALNAITDKIPFLNNASGFVRGLGENGKLGMGLGLVPGFGSGANAIAGLFGAGGSNESRMYVGAAATGSAASMLHSAGGYSGVGGGGSAKAQTSGSTGAGQSGTKLIWPVRGPLTAGFNQGGGLWSSGHHTGQDIAVPDNTPVKAAAAGVVNAAVHGSTGYGNYVKINHGNGIETLYGHNTSLKVSVGQSVRQGQVISYSGHSGNATGPHVHFEVRIKGTPVDPMKYLNGASLSTGAAPKGTAGGLAGSGSSSVGSSSLGTSGSSGSTTTTTTSSSTSGGGGGVSGAMGAYSEAGSISGALAAGFSGGLGGSTSTTSTTTDSYSGSSNGSGSSGSYTPPPPAATTPPSTNTGGSNHYNAITGTWGNSAPATTATGNRGIGQRMAANRGWTGAQWTALDNIFNSESGWRTTATNPSSGAYGIPQSLPASKMGSAGKDWKTNPATQIKWGLDYIASRYGDPIKAWDFHKKHNWYDQGAWQIKQDEDARVHKDEMVIPAGQARQIREVLLNNNAYGATTKGGAGVNLTFEPGSIVLSVGAGVSVGSGKALASELVDAIAADDRIVALQTGRRTRG